MEDFEHQLNQENLVQDPQGEPNQSSHTYTDQDGTVFEWSIEKNAWIPKLDDEFLAQYKLSYGGEPVETEPPLKQLPPEPPEVSSQAKRKANNDPCWFEIDEAHNTNVYVAGLPLDITEEEFATLMGKCGFVLKDPDTNFYKVKLYRDSEGKLKGDGLCCYIKVESVDLALKILDGSRYKDHIISVEPAKFELKGQYDPTKKPKKKKKKEKEKIKKKVEKLFAWHPDKLRGERNWFEKTVIIKNMFDPSEFDKDASLLLDYQADLREECSKCGDVKKVVVYDRNPEGVATITFKEAEHADECIKLMNKRYFAGRQLEASHWDGRTKYKVEETEEEKQQRLKKWDSYLEKDEQAEDKEETCSHNEKVEKMIKKMLNEENMMGAEENQSQRRPADEDKHNVENNKEIDPL